MNTMAQIYFNKGFNAELEQHDEMALLLYTDAINHDPNYAKAYINRGNVYLRLGKIDKGRQDHKMAKSLQPTLAVFYHNA